MNMNQEGGLETVVTLEELQRSTPLIKDFITLTFVEL